MAPNFTPIDDLIRQIKQSYTPPPSPRTKETEPLPYPGQQEQKDTRVVVEHKELDEEVKPYIQAREETVEIPPDLQQMGVQTTPTALFQTQQVQTLIPDEEIIEGLHQPITSSFRWLAELALYILKHAHIVLKKVHGKIMRVVKT